MRIHIVLNDEIMTEAMKLSHVKTKREVLTWRFESLWSGGISGESLIW